MKKLLLSTIALATIAYAGKDVAPAAAPVAPIEPVAQPSVNSSSFNLVGLQIGTLGVGANFAMPINKNFQARLNINGLKVSKTKTKDNITYDADLKLFTAGLLLDYYPMDSSTFHLSLGAYYNKNKVTGTATPNSNKEYTINGRSYSARAIKEIDASLTFKKFAPYLGLGWGGKLNNSGWSWNLDLGVMYHSTPKFSLKAVQGDLTKLPPGVTWNDVVKDVAAQEAKTQSDVKDYKFYPVVSVGFVYRF